jgi:hypothetical protein
MCVTYKYIQKAGCRTAAAVLLCRKIGVLIILSECGVQYVVRRLLRQGEGMGWRGVRAQAWEGRHGARTGGQVGCRGERSGEQMDGQED